MDSTQRLQKLYRLVLTEKDQNKLIEFAREIHTLLEDRQKGTSTLIRLENPNLPPHAIEGSTRR